MTDDPRPVWDFTLSEEAIRKLDRNFIAITHHRVMTSVDTTSEWIELHENAGDFFKPVRGKGYPAPRGWEQFFKFHPNHAGLLCATSEGLRAIKRLDEIEAWEKRNAAERAEYERLRAKFGKEK